MTKKSTGPKGNISKRLTELRKELKELQEKSNSKIMTSTEDLQKKWRLKFGIETLDDHLSGKIDIFAYIGRERKTIKALNAIKAKIAKLQSKESKLRTKLTKILWLKKLIAQ